MCVDLLVVLSRSCFCWILQSIPFEFDCHFAIVFIINNKCDAGSRLFYQLLIGFWIEQIRLGFVSKSQKTAGMKVSIENNCWICSKQTNPSGMDEIHTFAICYGRWQGVQFWFNWTRTTLNCHIHSKSHQIMMWNAIKIYSMSVRITLRSLSHQHSIYNSNLMYSLIATTQMSFNDAILPANFQQQLHHERETQRKRESEKKREFMRFLAQ